METQEAIKLPEWKHALSVMDADGIEFGSQYRADWLEKTLRQTQDTVQFAMSISHIRQELRKRGMNFSSKGQNGEGWVVEQPAQNAREMKRLQRQAVRSLAYGVILGTNTPTHLLTSEEAKRHESVLERIAIRNALMQRSHRSIVKLALQDSKAKA